MQYKRGSGSPVTVSPISAPSAGEDSASSALTLMTSTQCIPTLPYDVLSVIFQTYVQDVLNEHPDRPPRPCIHEGPLLLSHVCQHWRDVAHSTSGLWSALTIDHDLAYPLILRYLTLAKETPLCLYITQWSYFYSAPNRATLDLLLSRAEKWQTVRILFDEETAIEILRRFDAASMGQNCGEQTFKTLEEATIEGSILVSVETSKRLWSFFLDGIRFPRLRRLYWSLDASFLSSVKISRAGTENTNLESLVHLKLTIPPPMSQCLELLRGCTNLQSLYVDFRNMTGGSLISPYASDVTCTTEIVTRAENPSCQWQGTFERDAESLYSVAFGPRKFCC